MCGENEGADQLRSYWEADLRLCFRIIMQNVVFLMWWLNKSKYHTFLVLDVIEILTEH